MRTPDEGQIVFVAGGVAQYRGGVFYSGMDDPRYTRPITWTVRWWHPINEDPAAELLEALKDMFANGLPEQKKSCGCTWLCACPERKALAAIRKAESR